jgi:hypothetical protein
MTVVCACYSYTMRKALIERNDNHWDEYYNAFKYGDNTLFLRKIDGVVEINNKSS